MDELQLVTKIAEALLLPTVGATRLIRVTPSAERRSSMKRLLFTISGRGVNTNSFEPETHTQTKTNKRACSRTHARTYMPVTYSLVQVAMFQAVGREVPSIFEATTINSQSIYTQHFLADNPST